MTLSHEVCEISTAYRLRSTNAVVVRVNQHEDEDEASSKTLSGDTHDTILCFSSRGRLYWLKVYQLPQASRGARGRPIVNILPLQENERITDNPANLCL